jgi:hypothetical protein
MITQARLQHLPSTLAYHRLVAAPSVMKTGPTSGTLPVLLALMLELGLIDAAFTATAVALEVVRHGRECFNARLMLRVMLPT